MKLSEIFAAAELAPDLRTLLLGPHAPEPDEWRRKRARGGGGHVRVPAASGGGWRAVDFAGRSPSGVRPSAKAALASGAQPAVFKVISAAHGRTRVAALLEYLGTRVDEHGKKFDIPIVTQSGAEVATAEARAALLDAWSVDFSQTPRARDVGIFVATIDVSASAERVRAALSDTFNGRTFVYALDNERLTVAVALTARGQGLPTTGPRIEAMADRLAGHFPGASLEMTGSAHAQDGIRYQLRKFARGAHGAAYAEEGEELTADRALALSRAWGSKIGTGRARDAVHMVFSARAGTPHEPFFAAVQDALDHKLPGRTYALAAHHDRQHVHVHVVAHARAGGDRLDLRKDDLAAVREAVAEAATERGIPMTANKRLDRAAARPFNAAHAAVVSRNEASPAAIARVQSKRAGATEITDHPAVIALATRAAAEWGALAAAFEAAAEDRSAAVAAAHAETLNAQLAKKSEIERSPISSINGRPIVIDDGAMRLIWDRAMSIRTDADLKNALGAIRGQFDEFRTELPEAQHAKLDTLFGSVVELGYARLSQSILAADGPYPSAETAARLTRGLSAEEIIDVLADRRDRLFANEFERLSDEGISTRIDAILSNSVASREPSTLILVAEERAYQWAIYSNDLIDGGNALAATTPVSSAAIRMYVQGLKLASPPDGVDQAVATLPDRQRVLALYASALDERAPPEEAAVFAAVGRKIMIEGAESLSPEEQVVTRLAVLDMVEEHQSAPLVDPALAQAADGIIRAARAHAYRSALAAPAGSPEGFERIDALTTPQRVAYLKALADDFAGLPGDNEQGVNQVRDLAEAYRMGIDVPPRNRTQAAALIDVVFAEFQNRPHVRGLDPDVFPVARDRDDPSIAALRGMAASLADIENLISSDIATVAQRLSVAIEDIEHHSTATPEDRESAESLRAVVLSVDNLRSIPIEFIPVLATIVASAERGDLEPAENEIERGGSSRAASAAMPRNLETEIEQKDAGRRQSDRQQAIEPDL